MLAMSSQLQYIKFDYNSCMLLPLTYWETVLKELKKLNKYCSFQNLYNICLRK
jgi:hypothetical protein